MMIYLTLEELPSLGRIIIPIGFFGRVIDQPGLLYELFTNTIII